MHFTDDTTAAVGQVDVTPVECNAACTIFFGVYILLWGVVFVCLFFAQNNYCVLRSNKFEFATVDFATTCKIL
jgi:hypothetical protein